MSADRPAVQALVGVASSSTGAPIHYRLYLPVDPEQQVDHPRMWFPIRAHPAGLSRWPLAVVLPGFGCAAESYGWLARTLADTFICTLTYSLIEQSSFGDPIFTPGIDFDTATPAAHGSAPRCTALPSLLQAVASCRLANHLDLTRIALIGHSAGGAAALADVARPWTPGTVAAVTYGAHGVGAVKAGWGDGTVCPIQPVPTLLLAGDHDGLGDAAAVDGRYGPNFSSMQDLIARTLEACGPNSELRTFAGAGHFALAENYDGSMSTGYLEKGSGLEGPAVRAAIGQEIMRFLTKHLST